MLKYAKIINEETKQCDVGLGDPDAPYKTIIVPAEYDKDGNIITPEHEEIITVGDYYKSIGMEEMNVEQAWDGRWFVDGYVPEKPAPTYEEIDKARIEYRKAHIDDKTLARDRKKANGTWTEADEQAYLALDAEVTAWIEENLPYPVGE